MALAPPRPLAAAADALEAELDVLVEELVARFSAVLPELGPDAHPELASYMREACRLLLGFALDLVRTDAVPDELPPPAIDEARLAAQAGISLDSVTRGYRIGHALLWERLVTVIEDAGLEAAARREALTTGSRRLFAGVDRAVSLVTGIYLAERERVVRSSERRRLALVRSLLDGEPVDEDELGVPLSGTHVAVVAWGAGAEDAVRALGAPVTLLVPVAPDTVWAWLACADLDRLTTGLDGAALALGDPLPGRDGFVRSHRRARAAHRVARSADLALVRYADVALEALTTADPNAARDFATAELGPLANGADPRAGVLRQTLRAWFAAGQNAASAAAALGVAERTVAYRLRTVEERLGHPPWQRRAELECALRILDVLAPP